METFRSNLSSFEEDEEVFYKSSPSSILSAKPLKDCSFAEQVVYMEKALTWLKFEISELQNQDKQLMKKFRSMISTVQAIKKFKNTVEEQSGILGDMESIDGIEVQPNFVDLPVSVVTSKENRLKRQVSDYQRYKRIGYEGRHVSFH